MTKGAAALGGQAHVLTEPLPRVSADVLAVVGAAVAEFSYKPTRLVIRESA